MKGSWTFNNDGTFPKKIKVQELIDLFSGMLFFVTFFASESAPVVEQVCVEEKKSSKVKKEH